MTYFTYFLSCTCVEFHKYSEPLCGNIAGSLSSYLKLRAQNHIFVSKLDYLTRNRSGIFSQTFYCLTIIFITPQFLVFSPESPSAGGCNDYTARFAKKLVPDFKRISYRYLREWLLFFWVILVSPGKIGICHEITVLFLEEMRISWNPLQVRRRNVHSRMQQPKTLRKLHLLNFPVCSWYRSSYGQISPSAYSP